MCRINNIWNGTDVFIIGGGASLIQQFNIPVDLCKKVRTGQSRSIVYSEYLKSLHNKNVIGVNVAYALGDWVDICFFGDAGFHWISKEHLKEYKGILVSCHEKFKNSDSVIYYERDKKRYGISRNESQVCWNDNSGGAAVNLAVHMGAKRIILVGFDMAVDSEGNEHWHNEYKLTNKGNHNSPNRIVDYSKFKRAFEAITSDLKELGISIYSLGDKTALNGVVPIKLEDL